MSNVTLLCTTDDPADDLRWHKLIREDDSFDVQVLPAWRPDNATKIEKPGWAAYLEKLGQAAGVKVDSFAALKEALKKRLAFFAENGANVSDHGVDYVMYQPASEEEVEKIFAKRLSGETLTAAEEASYKTELLLFLGRQYKAMNWVMQIHYSCKRDNNQNLFRKIGPDTGFDCISDYGPVAELADFLNALADTDELPKTILYSLNPADNNKLVSLIGCFQNSDAVGKIQHGSAWWFNDTIPGMIDQMTTLANGGILGNFIGMLTDSRSFLSYPRHELFRRIYCRMFGEWVENGYYPANDKALEKMVKGLAYNNAVNYFGFDLKTVD